MGNSSSLPHCLAATAIFLVGAVLVKVLLNEASRKRTSRPRYDEGLLLSRVNEQLRRIRDPFWDRDYCTQGLGELLWRLADKLKHEGRFVDACRYYYSAREVFKRVGSLNAIPVFEQLRDLSKRRHISESQYAVEISPEELLAKYAADFGGRQTGG